MGHSSLLTAVALHHKVKNVGLSLVNKNSLIGDRDPSCDPSHGQDARSQHLLNVVQTQANIKEFREQFKEYNEQVKNTLERIEGKVTPNERVFRKGLPLRDPGTNTIYSQLMKEARQRGMRIIEYSVFLATGTAITLLAFTELRINEIRTFNKEQYLQLIEEGRIQVYQSKQNKYRTILLSNGATKALNELKAEAMSVFRKRETLAGGASPNNWITFVNNKLKDVAKQHRLFIKPHSFRINFITSLLKFAPIQQVSGLVGHQDVKSTMAYNRYTLDQTKARDLMDRAIYNVKDQEGREKEGEEEIKQRIIKEIT